MHIRTLRSRSAWVAAGLAVTLAAGCGSEDSSSSSSSSQASAKPKSDQLGTPKQASGEPLVFGLLNLGSGPVTFPEYTQAAEVAVKYVNEYKGGIGGRPMKLELCPTDGQPSTSARCAGQVLDKKPVAIIGGADTGNPGAIPVYQRAKLAYLGGVPFTPVEGNAPNAVHFVSVAGGDVAATVDHVRKDGAKKLSVIYTDDTQGKAIGLGTLGGVAKQLGMEVTSVPVAPSASDLSSVAAAAVSSSPDAVFIVSPNACPGVLKALKSVGNTAKIAGLDVCVSPQALEAAGEAAEGLLFAQPFPSFESADKDTRVFLAAIEKFGSEKIALDSISQTAFNAVMNVQAKLDPLGADGLSTDAILEAFKSGADNPNFMAHPYTCDGKALPASKSICNAHQIVKQVKGGKIVEPAGDEYVTAGQYLR